MFAGTNSVRKKYALGKYSNTILIKGECGAETTNDLLFVFGKDLRNF